MGLPIWQIDAFAEGPFRGNPAAIVQVGNWLPDALMQAIAAENNQTTTAFLRRRGDSFALRWFTPTMEEKICGHATLASAALVLEEFLPGAGSITFDTPAGKLTVTKDFEGLLELDFPTRPPDSVVVHPGLLPGLGLGPREVLAGRDYLVICETAEEVRGLTPDAAALARTDRHAVIVTGPGDRGFDCVSRFFAPGHGIPEDHATGAAHATVAPYWSQRLGKTVLRAEQASPRGGVFRCTMLSPDRVALAGRCAFYMRGEISV